MDPYLAIASKRDERAYADTPIPAEVRQRILDAGRLSGSSKNRQRWESAAEICGGDVRAIISFGYPARPRNPGSRTAEEWSARANRKPLSELVREVG